MIKYYKLFDLLNRKEMKKSDLRKILSPKTIAKLSKGEYISLEAVEKICKLLHCQPGDIMEYIEMENVDETHTMQIVPQLSGKDYIGYTPKGEEDTPEYNQYRISMEYMANMEKN